MYFQLTLNMMQDVDGLNYTYRLDRSMVYFSILPPLKYHISSLLKKNNSSLVKSDIHFSCQMSHIFFLPFCFLHELDDHCNENQMQCSVAQ